MSEIDQQYSHSCESCGARYKLYPHQEFSKYCPPCRGKFKEKWMESVLSAVEEQGKMLKKLVKLTEKEI